MTKFSCSIRRKKLARCWRLTLSSHLGVWRQRIEETRGEEANYGRAQVRYLAVGPRYQPTGVGPQYRPRPGPPRPQIAPGLLAARYRQEEELRKNGS